MSHELQINSLHLSLSRYPKQATNDLQAWNAADELMLNFAFEQTTATKRILIMNDEFGALACALLAAPEFADSQIHWLSDSFIAQQALAENLKANNLTMDGRLTLLSSTDSLPASDMVLMRQPKSLNYLEYQLIALQAILSADSLFACGVMLKNLPKSVFSLFEKHLGKVSTSLAKKKARLLFGHYQGISSTSPYPKQWKVAEHQFKLNDHANVFCFGKLDIGSRFMLENFPQGDFEAVVDLGCGNGLLGLQALKHYPKAKVSFCDESAMALASAKNNVSLNFLERLADCEFNHDNALQHQADNSADLVLCNPPFHQQNTISTHIAQQMFRDAKRCLRSGGQLIVVANRHLGYHPLLKSYFGGYKLLASNNKFVILSSTKR